MLIIHCAIGTFHSYWFYSLINRYSELKRKHFTFFHEKSVSRHPYLSSPYDLDFEIKNPLYKGYHK